MGWEFEDYISGLSKDDWVQIFNNPQLLDDNSKKVLFSIKDFGGQATCTELSNYYGEKQNFYYKNASALAERIIKNKGLSTPQKLDGKSYSVFLLFTGKVAEENTPSGYIWKLRPEVSEALNEIEGVDFFDLFTSDHNPKGISEYIKRVAVGRPDDEIPSGEYVKGNEYFDLNAKTYELIKRVCGLDKFSYEKYSGQNQLAKNSIVWIALKDRREKQPSRFACGVYIVFLFSVDKSCVYLNLGQSIEDLSMSDQKSVLLDSTNKIRGIVSSPEGFTASTDIDLASTSPFAELYKNGTVFWKRYDVNAMPSDEELIKDIRNLIASYDKYESSENPSIAKGNCNYWVFRHKGADDNNDLKNFAIAHNFCMAQYEHNVQDNGQVTRILDQAIKIKEGDIVFLTRDRDIFAYGIVKSPRVTIDEIADDYQDYSLNHKDKPGLTIGFKDSPLYFDYKNDPYPNEDGNIWGQRIDVDEWININGFDHSVYFDSGWISDSARQNAINMIDSKKGEELVKMLKGEITPVEEESVNETVNEATTLLKLKKNIILQGAPGTGKTYNTTAIAVSLLDPSFADFNDQEALKDRYMELRNDGRIEFVTFHQSMDYEDFVEGLKPRIISDENEKSTGVTYSVEDGIFKQICNHAVTKEGSNIKKYIDKYLNEQCNGYVNRKVMRTLKRNNEFYVWRTPKSQTISIRSVDSDFDRAKGEDYAPTALNIEKVKAQAIGEGKENNWEHYASAFIAGVKDFYELEDQKSTIPYLLIIDEINRGNVSKIFGELITLLEADKRSNGEDSIVTTLPYSKEPFSVPSNLYIMGTMNTTDRSVGSLDYAVRRRFSFVTMKSNRDVIEKNYSKNEELKQKALSLFDHVQTYLKDSQHEMSIDDLMVGHSYFMIKKDEQNSDLTADRVLEFKVKYEIMPLLEEYEKDGIITPKTEARAEFYKWVKDNFS